MIGDDCNYSELGTLINLCFHYAVSVAWAYALLQCLAWGSDGERNI